MSIRTTIEWTRGADGKPGATWNPVTGCTKLSPASPGCENCYAATFAERWRGTKGHYFEHGFDVQIRDGKLGDPLRWKRPRRIFVNSMSDLFHDRVDATYIAQVFAVMALAPQHTFQVLTKRHARMRSLLTSRDLTGGSGVDFEAMVRNAAHSMRNNAGRVNWPRADDLTWPLSNVWLGVSTENQKWADIRIPALMATPAAVRWISAEPLLGPVDVRPYLTGDCPHCGDDITTNPCGETHAMMALDGSAAGLDWVVVGGESGPGARPMHPQWARSLRDQCTKAGIPWLFKQWGAWSPIGQRSSRHLVMTDDGNTYEAGDLDWPDGPRRGAAQRASFSDHHPTFLYRVGKRAAGRELDGRTWDEFPQHGHDGHPAIARDTMMCTAGPADG